MVIKPLCFNWVFTQTHSPVRDCMARHLYIMVNETWNTVDVLTVARNMQRAFFNSIFLLSDSHLSEDDLSVPCVTQYITVRGRYYNRALQRCAHIMILLRWTTNPVWQSLLNVNMKTLHTGRAGHELGLNIIVLPNIQTQPRQVSSFNYSIYKEWNHWNETFI